MASLINSKNSVNYFRYTTKLCPYFNYLSTSDLFSPIAGIPNTDKRKINRIWRIDNWPALLIIRIQLIILDILQNYVLILIIFQHLICLVLLLVFLTPTNAKLTEYGELIIGQPD